MIGAVEGDDIAANSSLADGKTRKGRVDYGQRDVIFIHMHCLTSPARCHGSKMIIGVQCFTKQSIERLGVMNRRTMQ